MCEIVKISNFSKFAVFSRKTAYPVFHDMSDWVIWALMDGNGNFWPWRRALIALKTFSIWKLWSSCVTYFNFRAIGWKLSNSQLIELTGYAVSGEKSGFHPVGTLNEEYGVYDHCMICSVVWVKHCFSTGKCLRRSQNKFNGKLDEINSRFCRFRRENIDLRRFGGFLGGTICSVFSYVQYPDVGLF